MQSTVMSRRGFLGLGAAVAGAAATGLVPSGAWAGPKPAWPTTIDLPDGLHPDAETHLRIGDRFAATILGSGGFFASA